MVRVDATQGLLQALVDEADWVARELAPAATDGKQHGSGRELFGLFRQNVTDAESGARSCLT